MCVCVLCCVCVCARGCGRVRVFLGGKGSGVAAPRPRRQFHTVSSPHPPTGRSFPFRPPHPLPPPSGVAGNFTRRPPPTHPPAHAKKERKLFVSMGGNTTRANYISGWLELLDPTCPFQVGSKCFQPSFSRGIMPFHFESLLARASFRQYARAVFGAS